MLCVSWQAEAVGEKEKTKKGGKQNLMNFRFDAHAIYDKPSTQHSKSQKANKTHTHTHRENSLKAVSECE